MDGTIHHDPEAGRFSLASEDGEAHLDYVLRDATTMETVSTWTPPAARGRGLAARLARAALDHARAEGLSVVPTCWYVAGWIERHPDYADLLA